MWQNMYRTEPKLNSIDYNANFLKICSKGQILIGWEELFIFYTN